MKITSKGRLFHKIGETLDEVGSIMTRLSTSGYWEHNGVVISLRSPEEMFDLAGIDYMDDTNVWTVETQGDTLCLTAKNGGGLCIKAVKDWPEEPTWRGLP